jgi:hypothetical protein
MAQFWLPGSVLPIVDRADFVLSLARFLRSSVLRRLVRILKVSHF